VSLVAAPAARPGFDQQSAYVPLTSGDLMAIDLDEGRVVWTVGLETASTPATGDGLVFVAGDALVTALDQTSGRTVWRTPVDREIVAALHWDGGFVVACLDGGELVAINALDGQILWRSPLGATISTAPSVADDLMYAALENGHLLALSLQNGERRWMVDLGERVTGILVIEEQLLAGTRGNRLHSISLDRGRIRWSQRAGADVIGAPVADEQNIYFVAFDNVLRALHRGNGHLRWSRNLPSRPSGGALRVNEVVLVPLSTNDIGAYLASTGAPSFTIQAVGELGGPAFLRENARPTLPRLIAISREGALQGFASRVEAPPVPLAELPGARVGS
jgi:outer membrane protein assembly factor BamB